MDAVSATIAMAEAQARMGLHDDAIAELRKAVRVHPRNLDIHEKLGRILFQQQRFESALPHLQRVLRKKSDSGELNMLVGDCALSTGRSKAAQRSFERCIAVSYQTETALASIGRSLITRRKAQAAWDRIHEAFVSGGSVSKQLHEVLEMCAPLVGGQVPALAESFSSETPNLPSTVDAPPGSIEAMAGIVHSDVQDDGLDIGLGLLDDDEDTSVSRLQIAMPGSGLDTPESRAVWDEPLSKQSNEELQWQDSESDDSSWIEENHWDSIPVPESNSQPIDAFASMDEPIPTADLPERVELPFGVGVVAETEHMVHEADPEIISGIDIDDVVVEMEPPVIEPIIAEEEVVELPETQPEPARQEMPLPGSPVMASEGLALTELARLPQQQRVWCWTTSYGEVPWGMELLKSRPDDRVEAAAAELNAWSMQNPGMWLAIDLQEEGRVPVNLNNVGTAISGLNNPVILLVPEEVSTDNWPLWGQVSD